MILITPEMEINFYTLGVYGLTSEEFFNKILSNKIDTFIDIRRRRAVRGSLYSFVNSNRLQQKLKELGINYLHIIELSPSDEIRKIQNKYDNSTSTTIRNRKKLDDRFITEFKKRVLDHYDFNLLFDQLKNLQSNKAVFFCVESAASACHRSLVTDKLAKEYSFNVIHF
jgi:uncharacterized protein (DUF488 family)